VVGWGTNGVISMPICKLLWGVDIPDAPPAPAATTRISMTLFFVVPTPPIYAQLIGNMHLRAERLVAYEGGYRSLFGKKVHFTRPVFITATGT
jgi:hypothetical protein